jgi:N-acetylmuramoyl-L-alanine amidase
MSDRTPPPNSGDDRDFEAWMKKRQPQDEPSPSAAFMEMMRQAAARHRTAEDPAAQAAALAQPADAPDLPQTEDATADAVDDAEAAYAEEEIPHPAPARPQRRRRRRGARTLGVFAGILRTLLVTVVAAVLTATIFTWFTPSEFISSDVRASLSDAIATDAATFVPTSQPTPNWARRIGIVSGHRGPQNDPGAVCPDGLTEAEINFNVATRVVQNLQSRGYTVDLLDEFDPRLDDYRASALVSIHANTCQDFGERVSGFLISTAAVRAGTTGVDDQLVNCVARHYATASGLERRIGLTVDMTDYHTFREINALTPAAIIELGFMLADRDVITGQPDGLATGITNGILCFLEPQSDAAVQATLSP